MDVQERRLEVAERDLDAVVKTLFDQKKLMMTLRL